MQEGRDRMARAMPMRQTFGLLLFYNYDIRCHNYNLGADNRYVNLKNRYRNQ